MKKSGVNTTRGVRRMDRVMGWTEREDLKVEQLGRNELRMIAAKGSTMRNSSSPTSPRKPKFRSAIYTRSKASFLPVAAIMYGLAQRDICLIQF